jgi:hypothetical protein
MKKLTTDHGPADEFEIEWVNGDFSGLYAHYVSFEGGGLDLGFLPSEEGKTVTFTTYNNQGAIIVVLYARAKDIVRIINLKEANEYKNAKEFDGLLASLRLRNDNK